MKKEYLEALNLINDSYNNKKFDKKFFEFYETRREKNKHGIGILKINGVQYYFKIVNINSYVRDENKILSEISPYFCIAKKYGEMKTNSGEIINLYKYIPATKINAFNYLRNSNIQYSEKKEKAEKFFQNKFELMRKNYKVERMNGKSSSDRWFWGRIKNDERIVNYYGKNFELLYNDILKNCPELLNNFQNYLSNLENYLNSKNLTITTYSHGDFHDFNFSLDGILWDIDTFDFNPLLNDFTTYYWHFYAREDYLIYKYCPWLTNYMENELNIEELKKIREIKKSLICNWYIEIENEFKKNKIEKNINQEFIFKLFCRIFLINNVIEYEEIDKIKNYNFFNYFLINQNRNLKDLLFSSNIKFETIESENNEKY